MRRATRTVTAVAVVGLLAGCSAQDSDSARNEERRHTYCSALGSWQQEKGEAAGSEGFGGPTVVAAAKQLNQNGLDRDGSRILEDTTRAVGGDTDAEWRAVSYCDDVGYETLMKAGRAG
ncbi:hypothetical protein AB0I66_08390 [Streptomyces sp. NPDC050439]|uniref:hypothetical protein n=1 Tax=unclassified Streptomyces TaxID=2593676 RepID=UPI00342FC2BF